MAFLRLHVGYLCSIQRVPRRSVRATDRIAAVSAFRLLVELAAVADTVGSVAVRTRVPLRDIHGLFVALDESGKSVLFHPRQIVRGRFLALVQQTNERSQRMERDVVVVVDCRPVSTAAARATTCTPIVATTSCRARATTACFCFRFALCFRFRSGASGRGRTATTARRGRGRTRRRTTTCTCCST